MALYRLQINLNPTARRREMTFVNHRSCLKLVWIIALSTLLIVGWSITPANANHCKGPHKNDPGCDSGGGGSEPPNPAIVYVSGNSIKVANADGSNQLTLVTRRNTAFWSPSWSADGDFVIFASDLSGPGIYRVRIHRDTGFVENSEQLIPINDVILANAVWSPEKTANEKYLIAYSDYVPGSNQYDIYLLDPAAAVINGINPFNLTNTPDIHEVIPSWSPDATKLVAVTLLNTNNDAPYGIEILTLGTGCVDSGQPICELGPRRDLIKELSPSPFGPNDVWSPSWANTGNKIAVTGGTPEDQNGDIWVIEFDNEPQSTEVWNLTNTNSVNAPDRHETIATWSPDDSQIMYQAWDYLCQPQTNKKRGYNLIIRNVGDGQPGDPFPDSACEEKMIVEGNARMPSWWRGPSPNQQ